jgi:cell wall integrity and stress response component
MLPGSLAFLALFMLSAPAQAFDQPYCSTQNTGTGDAYSYDFQSNGECTKYCKSQGTYAFAIAKWTDCWCSNYIPSEQTDISKCQKDCPGYPDDKCGDKDAGLYVYIKMVGNKPSGTAGGDSAPSSTDVSSAVPASSKNNPSPSTIITPPSARPSRRPPSVAPPDPKTVTQTIIGDAQVITVTPSERQTSSTPVSQSPSQRPSSTPDIVTSPITTSATEVQTSYQVITESGAVVTRTVIWQPTLNASQAAPTSSSGSSNMGAIIGGVVGGVVGILALVGAILFCLWRRKKQQRREEDGPTSITRNTSTMSKAGLISGRGEKDSHYPPTIATTHGTVASRYDNESISPISGSQRRLSQPMMIDSRLNPDAVIMFHPTFNNHSRESLTSIDDSRDYGRQLNVRNPDP